MKGPDHEVSSLPVTTEPKCGKEESGQTADGEQTDEAQSVEHGRIQLDRAFVHGGGPVEYLDGRRNRDRVTQQGEHQRRVHGDSGDKHVVSPDDEAVDRDGDTGERDKAVTEDALT